MNEKLRALIDDIMDSLGFHVPKEVMSECRKKNIIIIDDDTGEVTEVIHGEDDQE